MILKTWPKREREREDIFAKPERGGWTLPLLRFYYIAAKKKKKKVN